MLRYDPPRDLIVAERDKRLDAVLFALVEYLVIESKPRLICLAGIIWEDARPVDRQTETLKAHLREKRNILRIMVVKVNRLVAGVERVRVRHRQKRPRRIHIAAQKHVGHGQGLAVFQVRPL